MRLLFSQPWMLLGLAAAALPLLVHLFLRPKPRPLPFGPMALLLKSLQYPTSLWRLRQWLVYLLRTLLLLALAAALAHPWLNQNTPHPSPLQGEAATALVLDASFSMRYTDGLQAFALAQKRALQTLDALQESEAFSVILCNGAHLPPLPLSHNKPFWRRYIQEAQPSFLPSLLNNCMESALRLLQQNPMPAKRLVVVSDFARHALHLGLPPPHMRDSDGNLLLPWLVLYPVYEGLKPPHNRALLALEAESTGEGGHFYFNATLQNFSPTPQKDVEIQLRLNGQTLAKTFVDLPPHTSTRKTLSASLSPNVGHEVEIRLAPDGLPEDDAQTLWLRPRGVLHLLLVDGAPAADRQADEAYFVEMALAQMPQARLTLRDTQAAWRENLSHYAAVFLLNTPPPPTEAVTTLKNFVETGGGLWLSLGDNLQLEAWNKTMAPLLPRPLRWLKGTPEAVPLRAREAKAKAGDTPLASSPFAKLVAPQSPHPLLLPFVGEGLEGLLSARFFRHALLEAHMEDEKPMEVLLRLDDGAPLLVAHTLGKGRILTYTSSADRDWNDLPLRTAFLPLIQRSAQWLSGSLLDKEAPSLSLGQSLRLPTPQNTYVGPHGEEVAPEPEGAEEVVLGPFNTPGLWWPKGGGEDAFPLCVKPLPQESDLALLDMEEVRAWFGNPPMGETDGARQRPLWTALLLLGLAAFCMEMWLLIKP